MVFVVVAIAAVLTGTLSAIAGLGGGVGLLGVLAQFYAPVTAIPIQGGIQLVSNSSRAVMLRGDINWKAVGLLSILVIPASFFGVAVATSIPEDGTRILLGVFLLAVTWRPAWFRWKSEGELPAGALVGVGAASGFLNTTVGASGPFTSPFLKAATASHVAFVATAATSQILAHVSKLWAFTVEGFDYQEHLPLMAVGAAGTLIGTRIGGRLLNRSEDRLLQMIFTTVLTILALRLIIRALL